MTAPSGTAAPPAYRLRPDVRFRMVEDEGVVLVQRDARVLVVNDVGARILQLFGRDRTAAASLGELCSRLEEEYEVETTTLAEDVGAYLRTLVEEKVVEEVRERAGRSCPPTRPGTSSPPCRSAPRRRA